MKREILLRRRDLIVMLLKLFILEIWKENFEKKILEKGNPNLGITTLFRLHIHFIEILGIWLKD
jgi:hypothetical protein